MMVEELVVVLVELDCGGHAGDAHSNDPDDGPGGGSELRMMSIFLLVTKMMMMMFLVKVGMVMMQKVTFRLRCT